MPVGKVEGNFDEGGIGEEKDSEAKPPGKEVEFLEILPQEWFASSKPYSETAQRGRLSKDLLYVRGGKLSPLGGWVVGWQVDAAVDTVVVAPLGEFHVQPAQEGSFVFPQGDLAGT